MCDYEKKRFECDIYELTALCLSIIHFFLLHEISPRAEKICYSRVRNDNSMMPFVTRACFFVHVQKFAYWPWSWHLFRSPWPSFRVLAFLCTTLIFQELMKKRSLKKLFACFFVCAQKICIFIWNIRSVHAMLRTCKKWHHVHAMLCTCFCIKKKWTSHSSQIIIVSEQGKTTIRRKENERGIIHDIKKQYVFRHHPDCIFYIYVKGWQDDTAKD